MHTAEEIFGPLGEPERMAQRNLADPTTGTAPAHTSTDATLQPPASALRALADPKGSAVFWIGVAAVLGLAIVSGELKVMAALGGRLGKK